MKEFNLIPLTPDYSISSSGRILANGIAVYNTEFEDYIAIGSTEGELHLYLLGIESPLRSSLSLGAISIVEFSYLPYFGRTVIVAINLESQCYFFDIKSEDTKDTEWRPLLSQSLIFNPSCCAIFKGKSGSEILLGNMHGSVGYFITDSTKNKNYVWKYSHIWNLGLEITSIVIYREDTVIIGRGDGTAIFFSVGDNPERITNPSILTTKCGKAGSYVLVSSYAPTNSLGAVNGHGDVCFIPDYEKLKEDQKEKNTEVDSNLILKNIEKRPIFISFLNINNTVFIVVGSSDGCLFFSSNTISNFFRYEEAASCYFVGELSKPILIIVGQSGFISVYTKFVFLSTRIPNFLDFARAEIEKLRKTIGDYDTPEEILVATYLYMPLP